MKWILRRAVSAVLAIVILGLWTNTSGATPPHHMRVELDETHVVTETPCGFPIQEHLHGTERVSFHFDRDGNMTRVRIHGSDHRSPWRSRRPR